MSFMSKLGSILKIAAPIAGAIAIPGVGGFLGHALGSGIGGAISKVAGSGILGTATKVGSALSPALSGMAKGRGEAQQVAERNQLTRDSLNQRADEDNFSAPNKRLGTAASANMAMAPPAEFHMLKPGDAAKGIQGGPMFTGGANFRDPRLGELGSAVMQGQLNDQLAHRNPVRSATPAQGASVMDKILGGASAGAGILGSIGTMFNRTPGGPTVDTLPGGADEGQYSHTNGVPPLMGMPTSPEEEMMRKLGRVSF